MVSLNRLVPQSCFRNLAELTESNWFEAKSMQKCELSIELMADLAEVDTIRLSRTRLSRYFDP